MFRNLILYPTSGTRIQYLISDILSRNFWHPIMEPDHGCPKSNFLSTQYTVLRIRYCDVRHPNSYPILNTQNLTSLVFCWILVPYLTALLWGPSSTALKSPPKISFFLLSVSSTNTLRASAHPYQQSYIFTKTACTPSSNMILSLQLRPPSSVPWNCVESLGACCLICCIE